MCFRQTTGKQIEECETTTGDRSGIRNQIVISSHPPSRIYVIMHAVQCRYDVVYVLVLDGVQCTSYVCLVKSWMERRGRCESPNSK